MMRAHTAGQNVTSSIVLYYLEVVASITVHLPGKVFSIFIMFITAIDPCYAIIFCS